MNIGIVNDLPLAVEALRRVIALRTDHRVLWVATDGDEAVDFCVAHPPDLVLMDLVMPKLDAVTNEQGEIADVTISYPLDLTAQMLEYSEATRHLRA